MNDTCPVPPVSTVASFLAQDRAALRDPFGLFAGWQRQAPVLWVPEMRGWVVTDRDAAIAVLRAPRAFASDAVFGPFELDDAALLADLQREDPSLAELKGAEIATLLACDPPDHTRLRKTITPWFSAAGIARVEDVIAALVARLLPGIATGRPVDFVREYAVALPLQAIATLLGIPEAERPSFKRLAERINEEGATRADRLDALRAEVEIVRYFTSSIADPADASDAGGMFKGLHAAVADGRISLREGAGLCRELLVAGSDSTVNHLASSVLLLARHPDLLQELKRHPDRIEPFVEESLRLEPPFYGFWRRTTEPTTLKGVDLPADANVLLLFAATNRDPSAYDRAAELELTETDRRHLTFGQGIHFCIGAPLARMESRLTFQALVPRISSVELLERPDQLVYRSSNVIRGPREISVRFVPDPGGA